MCVESAETRIGYNRRPRSFRRLVHCAGPFPCVTVSSREIPGMSDSANEEWPDDLGPFERENIHCGKTMLLSFEPVTLTRDQSLSTMHTHEEKPFHPVHFSFRLSSTQTTKDTLSTLGEFHAENQVAITDCSS